MAGIFQWGQNYFHEGGFGPDSFQQVSIPQADIHKICLAEISVDMGSDAYIVPGHFFIRDQVIFNSKP